MRELKINEKHLDSVMKSISDLLRAGEVRSVTSPSDSWDGHRYTGTTVVELERKTGVKVLINIVHDLGDTHCQLTELKPYLVVLQEGAEIKGVEEIVSLPYLSKIELAGGFEVSLNRIQTGVGLVIIDTKKPLFGARSQTVSFFSLLGATLLGVDNGKK